jgi:hypothetical protein
MDQAAPSAFRANFSSLEQAMIHRIEAADRMLSGDHFGI